MQAPAFLGRWMRRAIFAHALFLSVIIACSGLSQSAEVVLYEKHSDYNNIIVSKDEQGHHILRFGPSAKQSIVKVGDPGHISFPYIRTALLGIALSEKPNRFLIIGLGAGSMAMFLRKYYPSATIDAVEIDPDVVAVAKKYFGFREDRRMRAHVADGRRFIETVQQPYDVILLDAFGARNVPLHLTTLEFLNAVRSALEPTGVVIANIWAPDHNPAYHSMIRTYQDVFDELYLRQIYDDINIIVMALPRRESIDRAQFVERARILIQARRLPFELRDVVRHPYWHVNVINPHGHVLRDMDIRAIPRKH